MYQRGGGHFAEMPTVADGRGVGVKNSENLPTTSMDGPFQKNDQPPSL